MSRKHRNRKSESKKHETKKSEHKGNKSKKNDNKEKKTSYNAWQRFQTFKLRGEWVELIFMAAAALYGFRVLKLWGDSHEYDVAIEYRGGFLRVQVKSASRRKGGGYLCRLRRGGSGEQSYNPNEVDLFAIYVLPAQAWYLIPTPFIFHPTPKKNLTFYPDGLPPRSGRHDNEHNYEPYREAWGLLRKSRSELNRRGHQR